MRVPIAAVLTVLLLAAPSQGAGIGAPKLSNPLDSPTFSEPSASTTFFDTTRFLTNAGVAYSAAPELVLEPELGVGYRGTAQEIHGGLEQSTHRLHARAGWRLSLSDTLYFSAAAKLSMLTIENTGVSTGEEQGTRPGVGGRTGYEFANPSHAPLRWTGEVGLRLSPRTDLMLYYDQDPLSRGLYFGQHQEERVGTRFIFRFK